MTLLPFAFDPPRCPWRGIGGDSTKLRKKRNPINIYKKHNICVYMNR
ncbi:hypothetical protein NQ315_005100 [Exocentrus adspersus]|uniref:Uncharacterized protein n=1 Tax=Exocentrus adspersus TaxID=1586481 RepID=A0AAV8VTK2_9CUCU|nr:hypothetical protein NQ315_005100 [Exocentrus adspersus]